MPILLILFIIVPIIEIGVFIQVGGLLGLWATLFIVLVTAIVGVNLLKQQGLRAWVDIQNSMAQGNVPALEMASAAQLLFAGGLLLTPGFVTDAVGFALMVPKVRLSLAKYLMQHWTKKATVVSSSSFYYSSDSRDNESLYNRPHEPHGNRTIEGEFEDRSEK